jgi:hypothetical protein
MEEKISLNQEGEGQRLEQLKKELAEIDKGDVSQRPANIPLTKPTSPIISRTKDSLRLVFWLGLLFLGLSLVVFSLYLFIVAKKH